MSAPVSDLAFRLKIRRKELGLSQIKLARRLGVSQSAIALLESGRNQTTTKIFELAEALETTPNWLLKGEIAASQYSVVGNQFKVNQNDYFGNDSSEIGLKYSLLKKHNLDTKYLNFHSITDNSMSPTLNIRDSILYITNSNQPIENQIFLILRNSQVICRRLVLGFDNHWIYRCDNQDKIQYADQYMRQEDKILGRVCFTAGFI